MPKDTEEREDKPRFQIVDRRVLTEEDRKGTSADVTAQDVSAKNVSAKDVSAQDVSANAQSAPLIEVPGQARPQSQDRPKLEIVGGTGTAGESAIGSSSLREAPGQAVSAPSAQGDAADASETIASDMGDLEDEAPMSDEEVDQMRAQLEAEQFAALEQEVGRPLTEAEKDQVRQMMERQAQSMSKLEVAPILLQTISELPRYAAVHLGLIANPYTGLVARNDSEARLAIEAFEALYDTIKTKVDPRAASELNRVLTDLKANYTRVSGATIGPKAGPRIIR